MKTTLAQDTSISDQICFSTRNKHRTLVKKNKLKTQKIIRYSSWQFSKRRLDKQRRQRAKGKMIDKSTFDQYKAALMVY